MSRLRRTRNIRHHSSSFWKRMGIVDRGLTMLQMHMLQFTNQTFMGSEVSGLLLQFTNQFTNHTFMGSEVSGLLFWCRC